MRDIKTGNSDSLSTLSAFHHWVLGAALLMVSCSFAHAEDSKWMTIASPGQYTSLLIDGGDIWCGSASLGAAVKHAADDEPTIYNRSTQSLVSNNVNVIKKDNTGRIWLGTNNGLAVFEGEQWIAHNSANSDLTITIVHDICIDRNNAVWVCGQEGVARWQAGSWTNYNQSNSDIPFDHVKRLTESPNGEILAAANTPANAASFAIYSQDRWANYRINGFIETSAFAVNDMEFNADGVLWLATIRRGLLRWDGSVLQSYDSFNSPLPNQGGVDVQSIFDLVLSADGSVVLAASGIYILHSDQSWEEYTPFNTELPTKNINRIALDADGDYWMATDIGLMQFDGATATLHQLFPVQLESNNITDLDASSQGGVWISSNNGVARIKSGTIEIWTNANAPFRGVRIDHVRSAGVNSAIATTFGLGLYVFSDGKWEEIGGPGTEFDLRGIRDLDVDQVNGDVWIASDFGLRKYADGIGEIFWNGTTPDYPFSGTRDVAVLSDGEVWVAGNQNGIAVLQNDGWTHLTTENSELASNLVEGVHRGHGNSVWITYSGDVGISLMEEGGSVTTYTTTNSELPFNTAFDITADQSGNTWFAFQGSIGRFDGSNWEFFSEDNSGISGNLFQSITVDAANNIWVGSYASGISFLGNALTVSVSDSDTPHKETSSGILSASLYPNPAGDWVYVKVNSQDAAALQLDLVDQSGKILPLNVVEDYQTGNIRVFRLDIHNLTQGLHMVHIVNSSSTLALPIVKVQ